MGRDTFVLYYTGICSVPLYFCIFAFRRIYIHRLDGLQVDSLPIVGIYTSKRLLTFSLVICSVVASALELLKNCEIEVSSVTQLARLVFYLLAVVAWSCSYYLLAFDFKRRIEKSWVNQVCYFVLNVPISLAEVFALSIEYKAYDWVLLGSQVVVNTVSLFCCLLLTFISCAYPNEFNLTASDYHLLEVESPRARSFHPEMTNLYISVNGYKTRLIEGKRVVYYSIVVRLNDETHLIKRTLSEIESVSNHLASTFSTKNYPRLQTPSFPDLSGTSMDDLVDELSNYFLLVSSPIFLTSQFLEFLQLTGCEWIQYEQEYLVDFYNNESVQGSTSIQPSYPALPSHVLFKLAVSSRINASTVEYCLNWICIPNGTLGSVWHRYSKLLTFHKNLGKLVRPAKLPQFPRKQYLSRLTIIVDFTLIDERRSQLETYYNTVLNDPAFVCTHLLEFICCTIPLSFLLSSCSLAHVVKLNGPITSETRWTDDNKIEFVYLMCFFKVEADQTSCYWTVSQPLQAFRSLATYLERRARSPFIRYYLRMLHDDDTDCDRFPTLSRRMENKCHKLQSFMEECLASRHILNCYEFRKFIKQTRED
jgi:hypothetical protein